MLAVLKNQLLVTPAKVNERFESKTVIVTGSNVGLGKEAARSFASLGAEKVILAVRNLEAGKTAAEDIVKSTGVADSVVEVWELDLGSFVSVRNFADRATKDLARVDVLLENAGVAKSRFCLTELFEETICVNVVNTFYLAFLMLPKLKETAEKYNTKTKLIIVSSEVHAFTNMDKERKYLKSKSEKSDTQEISSEKTPLFTYLNQKENFNAARYNVSKLLEVLVVRAIADKVAKFADSKICLTMLNPGLCHSSLARDAGYGLAVLKFFFARTTEVGARTLVAAAAADPEAAHGKYMTDGNIDDASLSPFVRSEEGVKMGQEVVWPELKSILEQIQPGVTSVLQ